MKAIRTFVMAADLRQFQHVADTLGISQQAISKRIATLESELGAQLLDRGSRALRLTLDGQAFLPHARELTRLEDRALSAVQKPNRTLRIALIAKKGAAATITHNFQNQYPDIDTDIVTVLSAKAALSALESGAVDATFRAIDVSASDVSSDIRSMPAYNEPHRLLVGPRHPLASKRSITLEQLALYRIWIPGIGLVDDAEWGTYYKSLADAFGLSIDATNSETTTGELVNAIVESSDVATLEGVRTSFIWPSDYDLRRIPLHPTPLYPHHLLWNANNTHPALALLKEYINGLPSQEKTDTWLPDWANQ